MSSVLWKRKCRVASYLFVFLSLILALSSCGSSDGRFRLEGRFRNLNQGEFYLYSPELGTIDTIGVRDGRFVYDVSLQDTLTLVMLFPNYSELPVFAHPGAKVQMKGDASHLKETEVKGTRDNDEMTAFRLRANQLTPPEVQKAAADFIEAHPQSPISRYLLQRQFLLGATPRYEEARRLCGLMLKAAPADVGLSRLQQQLASLRGADDMKSLPAFAATDTKGRSVGRASLQAEVNVIYVWAPWNYEGQNLMRQLQALQKDNASRLSVLGISLDPSPADVRRQIERDSIRWSCVCDGQMWQSPLVKTLGITTLPANIVTDKTGKVLARNLANGELRKKLDELLKK